MRRESLPPTFARTFHSARSRFSTVPAGDTSWRREICTPRKMQYCLAFDKHPRYLKHGASPSLLISIQFHVFLSPRLHRTLDVMPVRAYEISSRVSCAENMINPRYARGWPGYASCRPFSLPSSFPFSFTSHRPRSILPPRDFIFQRQSPCLPFHLVSGGRYFKSARIPLANLSGNILSS